nr:hypothetical protein [Tanacetum cinerariifolium]
MVVLELGTIWPIRKFFMGLSSGCRSVAAGELNAFGFLQREHHDGGDGVGNGGKRNGGGEADERDQHRDQLDPDNGANPAEVEAETRRGGADAGGEQLRIPRAEAAEVTGEEAQQCSQRAQHDD